MSEASAVLFDLDGTLLDLPVDIEPARLEVAHLLLEAGEPEARPLLAAIDRAAARLGVAGDRLRTRARGVIDQAELAAASSARARDGALDVATQLARRGLHLGIVTDNGRACLASALTAAGLDAVAWHAVTRDDLARPKPAPDGFAAAARALCPAGGELWAVGDSPRDIAAARAAAADLGPTFCLHIVAVLGGHGSEASLRQAGPDRIVSSLTELPPLVVPRHGG